VQRSALIDQIGKLKRARQEVDGTYVHFKLCLDGPAYRSPVTETARAHSYRDIGRIAATIRRIDTGERRSWMAG